MKKIYTKAFQLIDIKNQEDILILTVNIEPKVNNLFENTVISDAHQDNEDLLDCFKSQVKNKCEITVYESCFSHSIELFKRKYLYKNNYFFLEIQDLLIEVWDFYPDEPLEIYGEFAVDSYKKVEFIFFD